MWGVVVLFECCDALLAAFYGTSAFNSDLSKWETGKVTGSGGFTGMAWSKCTLLGVVFFFLTRILGDSHFFLFFWDLLCFLCVGCCRSL